MGGARLSDSQIVSIAETLFIQADQYLPTDHWIFEASKNLWPHHRKPRHDSTLALNTHLSPFVWAITARQLHVLGWVIGGADPPRNDGFHGFVTVNRTCIKNGVGSRAIFQYLIYNQPVGPTSVKTNPSAIHPYTNTKLQRPLVADFLAKELAALGRCRHFFIQFLHLGYQNLVLPI